MGATDSSMLTAQRKQMEIQRTKLADPEFYKLIDDKGKGDLVILAKTALRSNKFETLDAAIKQKIPKYLYNEGKGKNINLEQIVTKRVNESGAAVVEMKSNNTVGIVNQEDPTPQSKLIYFDIDKRGKNGETILHVCQMNNTKHHDLLTKRLIINFPQLINETCLGDEMYGQTIMHIVIAQENQLMLHFLLAHKADVHVRCCGSFFAPDDQSMKRIHEIGSEFPIVPIKTNYFGNLRENGCTYQAIEVIQTVDVQLTVVNSTCRCAYFFANDPDVVIRSILEILVILYTIAYVLFFVRELVAVKLRSFLRLLFNNPSRIFLLISLFCNLLIIPMRFACQIIAEDYLVIISIVCLPTYILYLGRGFKRITTFAYIIHRVIKSDMISYLAIYIVFLMGFSQAFYIIYDYGRFPNTDGIFTTPFQSVFNLISMADGDFEGNYINLKRQTYDVIGRFYIIIFAVFCQLLLVNLFIATLSDTYGITSDCEKEWLRQWATQILCIETTMSVSERKQVLEKYTNIVDGKRVMTIRWKQTEEERKNFIENKSTFKEKMVEDCRNPDEDAIKKVQ